MEKVIFVNTYKGLDYVLKIIERVAKLKGKYDVYQQMMEYITSLHNVRPWGDVQKYAKELGVFIYDGDKPQKEPALEVIEVRGKGKYIRRAVKYFFGEDVELDEDRWYLLTPEGIFPL